MAEEEEEEKELKATWTRAFGNLQNLTPGGDVSGWLTEYTLAKFKGEATTIGAMGKLQEWVADQRERYKKPSSFVGGAAAVPPVGGKSDFGPEHKKPLDEVKKKKKDEEEEEEKEEEEEENTMATVDSIEEGVPMQEFVYEGATRRRRPVRFMGFPLVDGMRRIDSTEDALYRLAITSQALLSLLGVGGIDSSAQKKEDEEQADLLVAHLGLVTGKWVSSWNAVGGRWCSKIDTFEQLCDTVVAVVGPELACQEHRAAVCRRKMVMGLGDSDIYTNAFYHTRVCQGLSDAIVGYQAIEPDNHHGDSRSSSKREHAMRLAHMCYYTACVRYWLQYTGCARDVLAVVEGSYHKNMDTFAALLEGGANELAACLMLNGISLETPELKRTETDPCTLLLQLVIIHNQAARKRARYTFAIVDDARMQQCVEVALDQSMPRSEWNIHHLGRAYLYMMALPRRPQQQPLDGFLHIAQ